MTYNVFGWTLNLAQSVNQYCIVAIIATANVNNVQPSKQNQLYWQCTHLCCAKKLGPGKSTVGTKLTVIGC